MPALQPLKVLLRVRQGQLMHQETAAAGGVGGAVGGVVAVAECLQMQQRQGSRCVSCGGPRLGRQLQQHRKMQQLQGRPALLEAPAQLQQHRLPPLPLVMAQQWVGVPVMQQGPAAAGQLLQVVVLDPPGAMAAAGLQQQLQGTLLGVLASQLLVRVCMQSQQTWQGWRSLEADMHCVSCNLT